MVDAFSSQLWLDLQEYVEKRLERWRSRLESGKVPSNWLGTRNEYHDKIRGKIEELKRLQDPSNLTDIFDEEDDE